MVLGRKKQWHYPLKFHGSGTNLKSTYKKTNEDLEIKLNERKSLNLKDMFTLENDADKLSVEEA